MERPVEEEVADWARGSSSRGAIRMASSVVLKAAIVGRRRGERRGVGLGGMMLGMEGGTRRKDPFHKFFFLGGESGVGFQLCASTRLCGGQRCSVTPHSLFLPSLIRLLTAPIPGHSDPLSSCRSFSDVRSI